MVCGKSRPALIVQMGDCDSQYCISLQEHISQYSYLYLIKGICISLPGVIHYRYLFTSGTLLQYRYFFTTDTDSLPVLILYRYLIWDGGRVLHAARRGNLVETQVTTNTYISLPVLLSHYLYLFTTGTYLGDGGRGAA